MGEREAHTEPFLGGQNTLERGAPAEKVKVKFKMAQVARHGEPDPLKEALTSPPKVYSDTMKFMKRPVQSGGHKYSPSTQWAPVRARPTTKATDPGQKGRG